MRSLEEITVLYEKIVRDCVTSGYRFAEDYRKTHGHMPKMYLFSKKNNPHLLWVTDEEIPIIREKGWNIVTLSSITTDGKTDDLLEFVREHTRHVKVIPDEKPAQTTEVSVFLLCAR